MQELCSLWVETLNAILRVIRLRPSMYHTYVIAAFGRAIESEFVPTINAS